jgi:hypothetical protein
MPKEQRGISQIVYQVKKSLKTLKGENYRNRLLIDFLRTPESIRASCNTFMQYACKDQLKHFAYVEQKLPEVADFVINIMNQQYVDLDIPYHSRWRHFEAAGINRLVLLQAKTRNVKSAIELVIVSILLDAGAGSKWRYVDHLSQTTFSRSEGLAVASFNLFMQGLFSSDAENPCQADAYGLQSISASLLADGLQVAPMNPLIGLEGRLKLLQQLGRCIKDKPEYFGDSNSGLRLGNILDYWQKNVKNDCISMYTIFSSLLDGFSEIWPGRYSIDNINLGDVWPSAFNMTDLNPQGFTPFHKLTQWLCYSLIEPLEQMGLTVTDLNILTGLPEYRNGGLFVDFGVLIPKNTNDIMLVHKLDSDFIIEWRAMTIVLLDKLAEIIRDKLSISAQKLNLIQVLQGGTWLAGRVIAQQLREDGSPPFLLDSDGTLF